MYKIFVYFVVNEIKGILIMERKQQTGSVDAIPDRDYGKERTPEREAFRKEANDYCCVGWECLD